MYDDNFVDAIRRIIRHGYDADYLVPAADILCNEMTEDQRLDMLLTCFPRKEVLEAAAQIEDHIEAESEGKIE